LFIPIPNCTVPTAVFCSQINTHIPRLAVLTGIAGSASPVLVKLVAAMLVALESDTPIPPVIVPAAVNVPGTLALPELVTVKAAVL
jgi:hypothetical protein